MGFLSKYKTDKTAETQGVWVEFDDTTEIKLARINNDKAKEMRRRLEKPYRSWSAIPDSVNEDILRKVVAHTVVLDWKGVTDDAGDAIAYTADVAEKLFKDFPDFFGDVVSAAAARETFQTEAVAAAKND